MIFVLVYEDIKDVSSAGRKYDQKYDEKSKKEIKMTRFPATGIEP